MANKKGLKFSIAPEEVSYTSISRSNNYNSANIGIKRADNEYMSISYEWSGETTPDFVMDLMGFMQANKEMFEENAKKKVIKPWEDNDNK